MRAGSSGIPRIMRCDGRRLLRAAGAVALSTGLLATAAACKETGAAPSSGGGTTAKAAARHRTGVPMCEADRLSVRLGRTDAGAGNLHTPLVFTNTGERTCELKGYPG